MFERLSILVVEDTLFVRNMISEILRALHVGRIVSASDGGEAIGMLRQISKNPSAAGVLGFDIILSDYLMSPINGAMLLRWIRQHEDSPDRFIPFIMLSGIADSEKVRETRDLGTTEFLAKPFSVKAIANHLIAAIDSPRAFVFSRDFFGPDRRRQRRPYSDTERRVIKPEEQEIVYSGARLKKLNPDAKVFYFQLPNRLREKIAGIRRPGMSLALDPEILKAAESQLDRLETDYADWVAGSVRDLNKAYQAALDATLAQRRSRMVEINRLANDLRGQGTTFGYPLITVFCRSLFECTAEVEEVEDPLLDFIKTHIDGISAVMREKIKGNGGAVGSDLVTGLEAAREKLLSNG